MLNSNREKLKKHNFEEKKLGKVVFHETRKVNSFLFVIAVMHFTTVVGNVVNIFWGDFDKGNITFNRKEAQNNLIRISYQNGK